VPAIVVMMLMRNTGTPKSFRTIGSDIVNNISDLDILLSATIWHKYFDDYGRIIKLNNKDNNSSDSQPTAAYSVLILVI
jgi:hypothetical protein